MSAQRLDAGPQPRLPDALWADAEAKQATSARMGEPQRLLNQITPSAAVPQLLHCTRLADALAQRTSWLGRGHGALGACLRGCSGVCVRRCAVSSGANMAGKRWVQLVVFVP